jgi:hypothetical protein
MAKDNAKPAPAACATCGESRPLRFKNFQFFWSEGTDMEIGELPPDTTLEIHPTFILVDAADGWRILVPMDRIRFINVSGPV